MHRQIIYLLGLLVYICGFFLFHKITVNAQYDTLERSVNQNLNQAIDTTKIQNPIRDGAEIGIKSPDGENGIQLINVGKLLSFQQSKNQTIILVSRMINYLLGFVSLIVFVYFIFEWYKVVVSSGDESAYKAAFTKMKNAAIAIAGISLSRMIVTFIFYVIKQII